MSALKSLNLWKCLSLYLNKNNYNLFQKFVNKNHWSIDVVLYKATHIRMHKLQNTRFLASLIVWKCNYIFLCFYCPFRKEMNVGKKFCQGSCHLCSLLAYEHFSCSYGKAVCQSLSTPSSFKIAPSWPHPFHTPSLNLFYIVHFLCGTTAMVLLLQIFKKNSFRLICTLKPINTSFPTESKLVFHMGIWSPSLI